MAFFMIPRHLFFPLVFLWALPLLAASDIGVRKNLFKIDAIEVVGIKKVEREAILEKIASRVGMRLDNHLLRKDIGRIYSLKYFEYVEARHLVRRGKNILRFKVVERPIVSKIVFRGNDEISDEDLLELMKTRAYAILDVNTIKADLVEIAKKYEEKGYYLAKVNHRLERKDNENVELHIHVKEFEKVRVKKIIFLGNKAFSDEQLKDLMETREEAIFSFMTGRGNFKEFSFQNDIERIKYFYRTKGHLQVNVGVPQTTVSEDKKWVFITVKVNEGPQFTVNEVIFQGETLFSEEELRKKIRLKSAQVYSEELLRRDMQMLTEKYQDKGYAFANVLRTLNIVPGENKVDVEFSFEKGKIVKFGKITIKGNTKTRDKVVRRELLIREGVKFSGSLLRLSKENVDRLGFFEPKSVVFNTISPPGKEDVLDVEIHVKEKNTGQISLGAAYSSETRFSLQASIAQRNFRGLGQDLSFTLNLSKYNKTYNIGLTEPYLFDTKWTAGGDIFSISNEAGNSFSYKRKGFDIRLGHPIFDYTRMFVSYKFEDTKISSASDPTLNEGVENGSASSIKTTFIYDKRNHRFEPTRGLYLSLGSEYVGLGGDKRWWANELDSRFFNPVYGDLIFRHRLFASKLEVIGGREIPRSEKFALGGSRNLRGYPYEAIGPKKEVVLSNGRRQRFNQRGLFAAFTTFELEHPLAAESGLKWVVFFDAGTAGSHRHVKVYKDYGFGFRWFSPIGVIRFEFGYPLGAGEEDQGGQFHFDIGQLF